MASIKQIRVGEQLYDLKAMYDVNGNPITTTYATKTDITNLIGGAPATLDTLKEIADVLNNSETGVGAINDALKTKVDKEEGKGLSTNDYTTDEKNKLGGIAAGAQVNTVTGVKGSSETSYRVGEINITKDNIGLANVDNTTDLNKPISTATLTALDKKVNKTDISASVTGETLTIVLPPSTNS